MDGKVLTIIKTTVWTYLLTISIPILNVFAIGDNYDETGFRSNRTYIEYSTQEHVNPFSGNLILSHTDVFLPGNGGLDLKIQRTYNSKIFLDPDTSEISGIRNGSMGIGWTFHFGRIVHEPFSVNGSLLYLEMPDGSFHNLYNNNHSNINSHINSNFITEDFWKANYDEAKKEFTMTLTDGTVYTFGQYVTDLISVHQYYATSIKDTNGNEIRIEYYDCCNMDGSDPETGNLGECPNSDPKSKTPHIKRITDSVGRIISFDTVNNACRGNAVSTIDVNGKNYIYSYFIGNQGGSPVYFLKEVKPPEGPGWKYFYDGDGTYPDGELISVTHPSGGVVEYRYDTLDLVSIYNPNKPFKFRAIKSRSVSGPGITPGTWTYSYDPSSNQDITTVSDSCENKTVYKFYGLREGSYLDGWAVGLIREKEIKDAENDSMQNEIYTWTPRQISDDSYDPVSGTHGSFIPLLNSKTINRDGSSYSTNFTYDTFYGAPTRIEESGELIRTTEISYYENLDDGNYIVGKPRSIIVTNDSETKTISNSYDSKGNLLSEDRYGVLTEFSYHPDGNLEWKKNARGFYTHFDQYNYGMAGRIRYGSSSSSASNPVYSEAKTINWEGTIASLTNGRGYETSFSYDGINRLIAVTPPPSGEARTVITYDNTDGRSYIVKKGISEVRYNFDGLSRPIGTASNIGVLTEKKYDQCGRKIYESLPYAFDNSTPNTGDSFTYDALGRVTRISHPDNTSVTYSYSGNTVTINNERGIATTYSFKSFGDPEDKRLYSVKDAQNNTTSYEYDLLGNIIRVDSPAGGDRVFNYDPKGFLASETHPESGTTTYSYDEIGNVISKTSADGKTITYLYDQLNRLTLVDHPSPEDDVFYEYDNANNRILMESSSGSYSYSYLYDQSNRLIRQDTLLDNISYSVDFVYDERNNLVQAVYPSGEIVNYFYDAGNRLLDIYDQSNILFIGNTIYHPSGAPAHHINAIGVTSDFTYDNRHRLKTIKISRTFPFLTVLKNGLGNGTVTSNPLGIDCGQDCTQIYPAENIEVTLTAMPDDDSNFAGWSGDPDCSDGIVIMDGVKTCIANFALKANQHTLTVTKNGTGSGTVTSSPQGIECGDDCVEAYDFSTEVTLTAVPESGSNFIGWGGDADCSDGVVKLDADKTCIATFDTTSTAKHTLIVGKSGQGSGTVTSSPPGIDCGNDCGEEYDENTQVALTAIAGFGSTFIGWGGDPDCSDGSVIMDSSKNCIATFNLSQGRQFTLTIQKNGTGSGRIKSAFEDPPGIDCGDDCTEVYDEGTVVFFEIIPDPGSRFSGWSGTPGCPTSPTEGANVVGNLNCTATFDLIPGNTLIINKQGNGFGTVTSSPGGISCGSDCNHTFDANTLVTLTAVPNEGSIFEGWSGDVDCSDGIVTMDASKTCTAAFTQSSQQFDLSISIKGFGKVKGLSGNPRAPDVRIDCRGLGDLDSFQFGNDCGETYGINTQVEFQIFTLSECPPGPGQFCTDPEVDYNSTFLGWDGDPDCLDGKVTMDGDKTCVAIFTPFKLDVFITGGGTVTRNPRANTCTTFPNCSKYYQPNTQVTLTPVPNAGSVFSGWSEDPDCSDGVVTMDTDKKCRATFTISSQKFPLAINKSGSGSGTVASNPGGINCGSDCTEDYAVNTNVSLKAIPDSGSIFEGWGGDSDCSDGIVGMDSSKSCTAIFTQSSERFTLAITKSGTGTGKVTSSPPGIDCGSDCTENYAINTVVSLTVIPDPGSRFVGWSGDSGCGDQLTLNTNKNCVANFEPDLYTLTVNKSGAGTGTVTSNPGGIDCGSDCLESYPANTQVTLTAVPDTGFVFAGWTGDDEDCNDGIVTIDYSKNCTARFGLPSAHLAYVTNQWDNSISVIDISSNIVVDTIAVGDSPIGIAITPDDAFIYVVNQDSNSVSVVDTRTNSVVGTVNVGAGPRHLAFSPDGSLVYVVNEFDNSISVIDTATNKVANTISVGDTPMEIAISPDGSRAYVTNYVDGSVSVIDASTNTVIDTVFVGILPKAIAISLDGNYVYVANSWNDPRLPGGNSVSIIDTFTNSVIETISVGRGPWSLAVNTEGTQIYVAHINDDIISIIDTSTNNLIDTINADSAYSDISVSPDGDRIYLVNDLDNIVVVADVPTKSLVDTINVGDTPREIVISNYQNSIPKRYTLTASKSGTGTGTITSSPDGINCGSDCSEKYDENTEITLTATPGSGSSFAGWSGEPDCSDGLVMMSSDKACTATFNLLTSGNCDCNNSGAIRGTDGNDILEGTPDADIICGFRGNDTIRGYGGTDCIDGGAGRDKIYGGAGNDKLYGGGGGDTLRGEGGSDYLDGGLGTDTLNGGKNSDTCINGETIKYCENLNSLRNDFSSEEYYAISADSNSKKMRTSKPKDLAKQFLKKNPDNLASIKQHTFSKNLKQTPRYSKLTSYVESLKLFLISLLFSANAYAQTITPTAFIHLEYSYDGVGNVTGIIDHTDSQNSRWMQYDGLDRLTGATGVWGPGSFSYDPIGNRTKKSIGSSNSNYSYGASDNRLSGYSHDAKGNLLQDDSFIYEYDSENRLVAVRSGANVIAEYQYDGDGRRIKKVANGESTYYAYGTGLNVLTELNGQGVPKYDYIYAGSRNVARVNFDENGAVQNKSFYHTDHLGSSLAMTDETTTVIWNQNYLPFGEPHGGSGVVENSRQYTGKEFEEETGLYYYGARYYHSGLGRFMSVDPAPADPTDPQSWNRYAYVLNNPYKYIDPDGQIAVNVSGLVELNSRVRNKLGFIPDFILDALLPVEPDAIVASSLLEPQALGIGAISKGVSSAVKLVNKTENLNALSKSSKVPYAGGFLRSFVTTKDEIYYRVFSGDSTTGAFLTKVKPKNREHAIEGLSLPPWNKAEFIQEVLVPAGTRLLRSRALPVPQFGRFRGGLEQFELLERIPVKNFGPGIPFE